MSETIYDGQAKKGRNNMIGDIKTVAQGTFDRYFRMKELYVILVLCIINVGVLGRYNDLTLGMGREFMIDGALAILTVVALITSMAVIFEKSRELREKTAHFIITKPFGRSSYIWGKFLGIALLSVFNVAIITIGALVMFKFSSLENMNVNSFSSDFLYAAILIAAESVVLAALGLFLSMFLSDTITVLILVAAFWVAHSLYILPRYIEYNKVIAWLADIFPNFYNLDIKSEVTANIPVPGEMVTTGVLYAALYAIALVSAATIIFSRKDIS